VGGAKRRSVRASGGAAVLFIDCENCAPWCPNWGIRLSALDNIGRVGVALTRVPLCIPTHHHRLPMARIAILEDQTLVLNLYCQLIDEFTPHEVVFSSTSVVDFLAQWSTSKPDLVLLDLVLPDGDGVHVATEVIESGPIAPKVMTVTGEVTEVMVKRALKARVNGFVDKVSSTKELLAGVESVLAGKRFLTRRVQELIDHRLNFGRAIEHLLSHTELRLLPLLALGHTNSEIADRTRISASTAQTHRRNVMSKLEVHTTVELVRRCIQVGVVVKQSDGTLSAPPWDHEFHLVSMTN